VAPGSTRDRVREERHGGQRDGYYAVADGPRWWIWDERMGARSNHDDASVTTSVAHEFAILLDPGPLLGLLRFRVTGSSQVADRPTISAEAAPRPEDLPHARFSLHQLGTGADRYRLEIDRALGLVLAVTALRDGEPFHEITTLAMSVDQPISAAVFEFVPPAGEELHGVGDHPRREQITLPEAQQRAPFTVLMPDQVPETWQLHCAFFASSQRPPSPAQLALSYHLQDGHESVSITQMASSDRASHHYENMVGGDDWQTVTRDGRQIRTRPAGWGQAQAHLDQDRTFVFLVSDNLTSDQIATIAGRLRTCTDHRQHLEHIMLGGRERATDHHRPTRSDCG
jgi:hypothetical protein